MFVVKYYIEVNMERILIMPRCSNCRVVLRSKVNPDTKVHKLKCPKCGNIQVVYEGDVDDE